MVEEMSLKGYTIETDIFVLRYPRGMSLLNQNPTNAAPTELISLLYVFLFVCMCWVVHIYTYLYACVFVCLWRK